METSVPGPSPPGSQPPLRRTNSLDGALVTDTAFVDLTMVRDGHRPLAANYGIRGSGRLPLECALGPSSVGTGQVSRPQEPWPGRRDAAGHPESSKDPSVLVSASFHHAQPQGPGRCGTALFALTRAPGARPPGLGPTPCPEQPSLPPC